MPLNTITRSLILVEPNDIGILPEAPPTDHHVVFADEPLPGRAHSAGPAVFSVLAGVGSPQ